VPNSHFILLIEDDPLASDALAAGLARLGIEPIRVAGLAEAVETVKSKEYAIRAVLMPSELDAAEVRKAMKIIRRREPALPAMVYGKAVDTAQRELLHNADVLLALWDGYDAGMLRFQVNRLISGVGKASVRSSRRAPTHTQIQILAGGREKHGVLYSIAEGGCFIETPRASMGGADLHLSFNLGAVDYEIDGSVAFSNVPGNLQRPNLPLGMAVRFHEMSDPTRRQLVDFIRERLESLEV